jgi:hypothetical protein
MTIPGDANSIKVFDHMDVRKPFTYTIHSRDRVSGSTQAYAVCPEKDFDGDWKVTASISPIACANTAANEADTIELLMRAGGIAHKNSSAKSNWCTVLSFRPRIIGGSGTFYVSGGFRGPIEVFFWDVAANLVPAYAASLVEHAILMTFEPI